MSTFDPNIFLSTTTDQSFETKFTNIPAGEYLAAIDSGDKGLEVRAVQLKDGSQGGVVMELRWNILDDGLKAKLNLEKPQVRQQFFLDLDTNGKLLGGVNNNTKLGAIRDAVGQNGNGPWTPLMLKGAGPAKIRVVEVPDKRDPATKYSEVVAVARMS